MAFKMKRPMIMGTPVHKHALKSIRAVHLRDGTDPNHGKEESKSTERKGDKEVRKMLEEGTKLKDKKSTLPETDPSTPGGKKDKKSDYDKAKEKDSNLDKYIKIRGDKSKSEQERADAQDKINEAYGKGPTDRGEKLRKKKEAEKKTQETKDTSKQETKKADTSGDSTVDKVAKGDTSGAEKASGRMKPGDKGYAKLPESEKLKIQKAAKAKHRKALEAWRSGGKKGKRPQRKDYF